MGRVVSGWKSFGIDMAPIPPQSYMTVSPRPKARGIEVVLIDTAGRLHTKSNLMDELRKVARVLAREVPGAPHEVLLMLDATVGQNALSQAKQFLNGWSDGIALTKLDGTARGGISWRLPKN